MTKRQEEALAKKAERSFGKKGRKKLWQKRQEEALAKKDWQKL